MRYELGRFHRPMRRSTESQLVGLVSLGDGSTLNLDFTSGVLDSRLTFTRAANTATVINSSGLVQTVNANVPRFDHDPTTLAPRGLLIEAAATNLVTYSVCSTTGWAGINATGTNNSATSPENTTTATLWTGGGGGVNRAYSAGFSVTSGSTYTISAYVKKPSSNAARYAKIDVRSAVEALIGWPTNGVLDLDTGIASGTGYTVTPMQNGWYRIVSTGTVNSTTTARMFLRITDAAGAEITSTNALLWWGAQVEAGSGASSYIPTTNSTATRNADQCTMPTSSFITGPLYPQTVFIDCIPSTPSGAFVALCRFFDRTAGGTFSYGTEIYYYNAATMIAQRKINASTNTERNLANGLAYGSRHKFALSVDSASFLASYDGVTGLGATTAPAALPTVVTHLGVGCDGQASPGSIMFGTIRQIKFWPFALPQATINALTT